MHADSSDVFIRGFEVILYFLPGRFLKLFSLTVLSDVLSSFPESRAFAGTCSSDTVVKRFQCWLLELEALYVQIFCSQTNYKWCLHELRGPHVLS